jgi:hypothetical protein
MTVRSMTTPGSAGVSGTEAGAGNSIGTTLLLPLSMPASLASRSRRICSALSFIRATSSSAAFLAAASRAVAPGSGLIALLVVAFAGQGSLEIVTCSFSTQR